MTYRTGRHEHRCIRVQLGPEPHDDDPLVGVMDTPELGRLVVELLNGPLTLDPAEVTIVHVDGRVAAYEWKRP